MDARTNVTSGRIPSLSLGDRMRMALGDRRTDAIAKELGVSRSLVSHWLNDHVVPTLGYLRAWAAITGVDYDWLRTGVDPNRQAAA